MALEGYPNVFAYNTVKLIQHGFAGQGFPYRLDHDLGNPLDVQAIGVEPIDWFLQSLAFRIYPTVPIAGLGTSQDEGQWFIRGVLQSEQTPEINLKGRLNLFDYSDTTQGLIVTETESGTDEINVIVPGGGVVHIGFVVTNSPDAPLSTGVQTRGTYIAVAGPELNVDVVFEARAVFEAIDDYNGKPFYEGDSGLFTDYITWPLPAPV